MTTETLGGFWTFALELAYGLSGRGVEIELATFGAPLSAEQWRQADRVPYLSIHEGPRVAGVLGQPPARVGDWLLALEHELRPDVVHVNDITQAALPWSVPVLAVGHACVYSWFSAIRGARPPVEWESYRRAAMRGLRAANGVAAPTYSMLNTLRQHYGGFASLGRICNGRDPQRFRAAAKEPFILTSGRLWDEAKNVVALAEISPRLAWPVYLAGDDLPTADDVPSAGLRTLGRLSAGDMADWMSRASVFALPARYEPFGFSALEAALSGCVLVLGDIPGLRELWDDAAIYVRPDDTTALLATLQELINDEILRDVMAKRALDRAREYSPQRMVDGYLHAYAHLAHGRDRSMAGRPVATAGTGSEIG